MRWALSPSYLASVVSVDGLATGRSSAFAARKNLAQADANPPRKGRGRPGGLLDNRPAHAPHQDGETIVADVTGWKANERRDHRCEPSGRQFVATPG